MRLVRFESAEGARTGVVLDGDGDGDGDRDGDRVLDLGTATVTELLADRALLTAARAVGASTVPLGSLRLLPPVVPGKILCIGYNYRGHVPAGGEDRPVPTTPDVFVKTPNTLGAPGDPVTLPLTATDVDYEGEIALVIGRGGRDIPLDEAASHIAGYTVINDVSERTWQGRSSQWTLGKCSDGFAPLGPWLVTPDEIADTGDLRVEVVRDGVVTVSQSTADVVFSMAALVHHLSEGMTLEPGDVIATGSPQKLPEALAAHRPLADGDAVTIRVDGIGSLTTTFRKARP
ncbi:fumarylacetoacetate hydrolase family protein [Rathayibacter sp. VKM Ac-2804]|uniref:fumarylacetoacetate hydrolase family protein n=1 Tax=Rathayibacter sp. VKM Ac-2804 TaxID=2609257 RepID=UPI001FCA1BD7|nr:fumarylacetoacetate hydrolase family protein [Rathayibacter sp. VKM Ac-2804]